MGWYVNFREKGSQSRVGGYLHCVTQREVDEFMEQCQEAGLGVYVEETQDGYST